MHLAFDRVIYVGLLGPPTVPVAGNDPKAQAFSSINIAAIRSYLGCVRNHCTVEGIALAE